MPGPTGRDKAAGVVAAFGSIWSGRVVDVGCRGRELEAVLDGEVDYVGVDIDTKAEVVADLGDHLPFDTGYADVVVALDVLEHTDDIYRGFAELCRVSRGHVVVSLPNAYDIDSRVRHLRGRPISKKYGLPVEPSGDRHRWFFSFNEARRFVQHRASLHGRRVVDERALVGPRRAIIGPAVRRAPNVLSSTYVAVMA